MPLVRISIPAGKGSGFASAVSDSIHEAMVTTIGVPAADRFQIVTEHSAASSSTIRAIWGWTEALMR